MFGLGGPEIVLIMVVVCLLFGGRRFADLGKGLGSAISGFKKGLRDEEEPPAPRREDER